MIRLTAPVESLSINTSSTSEIAYTVITNTTNSKGVELRDSIDGKITTATDTTIVTALAPASRIQINDITIRNNGILTNNVTVNKIVNGVTIPITPTIPLATGEYLQYTDDQGWVRYDAGGQIMVVGSQGPPGTAGTIVAGTTTMTLGQVSFANSNGVSFGLNGDTLTASVGAAASVNISAGTTSNNMSAITFGDAGGVSFGLNGSVITAVGGPSPVNFSAGTTSNNLGSIVFSNANSISFGLNGSTLTGSFSQLNQAFSAQGGSSAFQTLIFTNSNGISFSNTNGSIWGSHNGLTSQSNQAFSAQGGSSAFQTLIFTNSNGFSFSNTGGSIWGSYTVPSVAGLLSAVNVSAGTTSNNLSAITFSDSNGVSFGLSGSVITASVSAVPSPLNVSAGTTSNNLQTIVFSNSNGLAFGLNGSTITGSYTVPSVAGLLSAINVSAGTTSNNLSAITFANSNGISFGLDSSTITANFAAIKSISAGTTLINNGEVVLSNSNGISFGVDGNTITASYTVPSTAGLISRINVSAGTTSNNLSAITFSNSNNVSFGLNGSVVTAIATMTQSNPAFSAEGGSSTFQTLSFGLNTVSNPFNISFSNTDGSVGALMPGFILSNNSNNNITFGTLFDLSLNSTVTADVLAQSTPNLSFYALNQTTQNSSTVLNGNALSIAGRGIVTVGYSNGSIQLSATQSNQNISLFALGNTTQNSSTLLNASNLSFNAIGSLTVGFSNGSIQLSAPNALTSQTNQTLGLYAVSNTTQGTSMTVDARTLSFHGAGIASVGMSNGSVVVSVPSGGGGLTNINLSAGTTSNNLSAMVFSNSNNVSFGLDGSTVTGSASFAQTNQNISLYALGNTTQNSSTVLNASNLSFNGIGNITVGFSNGSIQISQTGGAGGGIALANSQTTYSTGTAVMSVVGGAMTIASTTGQSFNFSVPQTSSLSAVGQLTISTNGSTISFSAGSLYNSTVFGKQFGFAQSSTSLGQNSLYFSPEIVQNFVTASVIKIPVMMTLSSSNAGAFTRGHTASFAVYTRQSGTNSSALARIYSTSYTIAAVMSSNAQMSISIITAVGNSTSYSTVAANSAGLNLSLSVHGPREFIMPWATSLSPGEYWMCHAQSSSSAGGVGNVLNISHIIGSSQTQNRMGVSTAASQNGIQQNLGLGTYSVTSAGFPSAVTLTEIRGGATWPIMFMLMDTV